MQSSWYVSGGAEEQTWPAPRGMEELSQHLRQLSGPLLDVVAAALRAAHVTVGDLSRAQEKFAHAANQRGTGFASPKGAENAGAIVMDPRVVVSALAFAKEQVYQVVAGYLASLLTEQQQVLGKMQKEHSQKAADQQRHVQYETIELNHAAMDLQTARTNTSRTAQALKYKMDHATEHLSKAHEQMQTTVHQHEAEIARLRALIAQHEDAVAVARAQMDAIQSRYKMALEPFRPAEQQLLEEQTALGMREEEFNERARKLDAEKSAFSEEDMNHNMAVHTFGQEAKQLNDTMQQLKQSQLEASAVACSQAAHAMRQLNEKAEEAYRSSEGLTQHLACAISSLQLEVSSHMDTHAPSLNDPKVQEVISLAQQCGIDPDTVTAAWQPGWVWRAIIGVQPPITPTSMQAENKAIGSAGPSSSISSQEFTGHDSHAGLDTTPATATATTKPPVIAPAAPLPANPKLTRSYTDDAADQEARVNVSEVQPSKATLDKISKLKVNVPGSANRNIAPAMPLPNAPVALNPSFGPKSPGTPAQALPIYEAGVVETKMTSIAAPIFLGHQLKQVQPQPVRTAAPAPCPSIPKKKGPAAKRVQGLHTKPSDDPVLPGPPPAWLCNAVGARS